MNKKQAIKIIDGNEATANIAYKVTELSVIYPITPSSTMGELADEWSSKAMKNIWGQVPQVIEMQSEAGASGALHGALQTGALTTTYTASQGLLLMVPNMYKIAGELTSAVMHVAARSLAAQALSIFGDHSDVMAVRSTGWAMLASASVQEAEDLALIAHAATLAARIPFLHFFDGFRTSHEINKINALTDADLHAMIDDELVMKHRERALSPEHPCIRGTAQNPDVYFQGRETVNPFYAAAPKIVTHYMERFKELTGRSYQLVDYYGAPDAERVIVVMGSGAITVRETINYLQKQNAKVGIIQIRLFRPFPTRQFLAALPKTTKTIAVLDRTKEPGAAGEPLYLDVISALNEAGLNKKIIGGRYGLGSKEFTPAMVLAIFAELEKTEAKNCFTIGINDDISNSSLSYDENFTLPTNEMVQALFYGLGADGTVGANKNTIKIIGEETDLYVQGYFVYDSKKSGSQTTSHLRFGPEPIAAPYLITSADFIACHQFPFIMKIDCLRHAKNGATFLLNSPYSANDVWRNLPGSLQKIIIDKKIKLYVIDAYKVAKETGMGGRINTIMQTCFFALSKVLPREDAILKIKETIKKTYSKKGEEVVRKNFAAVDTTLANLQEVTVPSEISPNALQLPPTVDSAAPAFVKNVTAKIMADQGDELPVSAMPIDGTYPSGTTKWEKRNVSPTIASWHPDLCIQCGQCSFVCPHGVIRAKHYSSELLAKAPKDFKSSKLRDKKLGDNREFTLQVYLEDCTGCNLCNVVCPGMSKTNPGEKAIQLTDKTPILETERANISFFETLPINERRDIDTNAIRNLQYLEPLFEFSGSCAGCGETPYIKLLTQLFGDRMLVANATGCTSIYGGNLPTTPWTFNQDGRGPAWSNSLFEDNAEFGFGFRLAEDINVQNALRILHELGDQIDSELVAALKNGLTLHDEKTIFEQRERIQRLKANLAKINDPRAIQLAFLADHFVKRSIWLIGGDGWAYDIGFGGLDHVLASGRKVNILVLDTEVYSNTGGQASKATPRGAIAKFAAAGKTNARKDLGLMMMAYNNIYVAQVAFGANQIQTLRAIKEAENYPGPSLIIAYSCCIAHGFDMRNGIQQQKLAVASGFWPLYRYNPERREAGLNPLQLDSPEPSITFKEYAYNETRFKALAQQHPEIAAELLVLAQKDIEQKWKLYKKLAE